MSLGWNESSPYECSGSGEWCLGYRIYTHSNNNKLMGCKVFRRDHYDAQVSIIFAQEKKKKKKLNRLSIKSA